MWAFRIAFVVLPFAILGGVEAGCRVRGYGGYPPVIRDIGSDGTQHWYSTYRPGVDSFFFTRLAPSGGMRTFAFTTPKPPGTIRIALFGGSAMQGYPQPLPMTNGEFLQAMLNDVWGPDRRAEVLNLGATAMASYPALCFLKEMLPHELDLVIIMSGHNEYYGAYGVASVHGAGASPAGMRFTRWARSLGIKQWLEQRGPSEPATDAARRRTLMERVVAVGQISHDHPLRAAAARTLEANLSEMVDLCRARGIPVIVCTLPVNEVMGPIGEDSPPELPPAELATFDESIAAAKDLLKDNAAAAFTAADRAVRLCDSHALARHVRAAAALRIGRHEQVREDFEAAIDFDTMPWRAVSAAQRAAAKMAERGAVVCDMRAEFRRRSADGAIGWQLMVDHVHMSLEGQAVFARVIAEAMTRLPEPLRVDPARLATLKDWRIYAERLNHSVFDDYTAYSRVRTLFDIPFMKRNNADAAALFHRKVGEICAGLSETDRKAVLQWEDPGLHVINHRPLSGVVAYFRMLEGDYAGAEPLLRNARHCVSNVSLWRLQYTVYLLECRRRLVSEPNEDDRRLIADALEVGRLLERFVGFQDPLAPTYLGMAYNLAGNHRAAVSLLNETVRYASGREGAWIVRALGDSLIRLGQLDRARLLLDLAKRDPDMAAVADELGPRLAAATPATR